MYLTRKNFVLLFSLILLISNTFLYGAFSNDRTLNTRARALGNAFTAIADDSGALVYNIAGLGKIDYYDLYFLYSNLYAGLDGVDLYSGYLSFIYPFRFGSFGLSCQTLQDVNLYSENVINLSFGKTIFSNFNVGLGISYLDHGYTLGNNLQNIKDPVFENGVSKSAFGIDLGVLYDLKYFSFGASANNINKPDIGLKNRDFVPPDYRVGATFKYQKLTIPFDIAYRDQEWGQDLANKITTSLGLEFEVSDSLKIRSGINNNEASLGFGLFRKKLFSNIDTRLDYSLSWPLRIEQSLGTHQLSLNFRFGNISSSKKEIKDKISQLEYDKMNPNFFIKQGLISSNPNGKIAELLFNGKSLFKFYVTIDKKDPYDRALDFAKSLSKLMKFNVIKDSDIKIDVVNDITSVSIANTIYIPINFDAAVQSVNKDKIANELLRNLKSILLVNTTQTPLKETMGKIVIEQGFTPTGEIANILINGVVKFTFYAYDKDNKSPFKRAVEFANIINKYIDTGLSAMVIDSEISYGNYYLLIKGERAVCVNQDAEFLGVDKESLIVKYQNILLDILFK